MKYEALKKASQWVITLILWLTISPLSYYTARKWKLLGKGGSFTMLLFSPLFGLIYVLLILFIEVSWSDYNRKHQFNNYKRLERITNVSFPPFKVVEYRRGRTSFTGDYTDYLEIEFKEMPPAHFYNILDSLSRIKNSDWSVSEDKYIYSKIWGNGFPAPHGENEDDDVHIDISILKGERKATVSYGMW